MGPFDLPDPSSTAADARKHPRVGRQGEADTKVVPVPVPVPVLYWSCPALKINTAPDTTPNEVLDRLRVHRSRVWAAEHGTVGLVERPIITEYLGRVRGDVFAHLSPITLESRNHTLFALDNPRELGDVKWIHALEEVHPGKLRQERVPRRNALAPPEHPDGRPPPGRAVLHRTRRLPRTVQFPEHPRSRRHRARSPRPNTRRGGGDILAGLVDIAPRCRALLVTF